MFSVQLLFQMEYRSSHACLLTNCMVILTPNRRTCRSGTRHVNKLNMPLQVQPTVSALESVPRLGWDNLCSQEHSEHVPIYLLTTVGSVLFHKLATGHSKQLQPTLNSATWLLHPNNNKQ